MSNETQQGVQHVYHVTAHCNMRLIALEGLKPRGAHGGIPVFQHGGYNAIAKGWLYLAEDIETAYEWFAKVHDVLEAHFDEPHLHVPVVLRISASELNIEVDPVGCGDVPGSLRTSERVHPDKIEFWHPLHECWLPLSRWGDYTCWWLGVREIDGEDIYIIDCLDPGGFKPPLED